VPEGGRIVIVAQRLGPSGAVVAHSFTTCRPGARTCRCEPARALRGGCGVGRSCATKAARCAPPGRSSSPGAPRARPPPSERPGSPAGPTPGSPAPGAPRPLPGLPDFTAGFEGWTRLNAAPSPPDSPASGRAGGDGHRGTTDVSANLPREAALRRPFPAGTIVVKAVRGAGTPGYALVATMRKIAGADPAHGDWRFVEYLSDGRGGFATGAGLSGGGCWACRGIAADTDWVFTATD
jgi:hypothetical protein